MSIRSITPQKDFILNEPSSIGSKPVAQSDFWQARSVQDAFCGMTSAEATRLALRLFGGAAVGTGMALVALAAIGTVTWSLAFVALPCLIGATGAILYSTTFDDYENPEELERFRHDAAQMNLDQVAHAHGWTNVLQWGILTLDQFLQKYRQQLQGKDLVAIINYYEKVSMLISQASHPRFEYRVPSPRECRGQWHIETAAKTFEEIVRIYPLEKLEKYNILEVGELNCLKGLKRDFDTIKGQHDNQVSAVEREFQNSTAVFKQIYDRACSQAEQLYENNEGVRELKRFDLRYARERQVVQNGSIQRKNEARARFDRSIAAFTNNGQIPYERLNPSEKAIYDQQHRELQLSQLQAENEAYVQIASIDARCLNDRIRFNADELRAKTVRDRTIAEAKVNYDMAVASHRINKEGRLRPIDAAFRSSVNDFNQRYRSYLRINGIAR
jgi:hypothetical protein